MTKEEINRYLLSNINLVSLGSAAYATNLTKEQIRAKWKFMRENNMELPAPPKELDSDLKYVYIPQLRANVRLKEGTTPEEYIARVTKFKTAHHYNKGAKKKEK
jgi:hypothetical protein